MSELTERYPQKNPKVVSRVVGAEAVVVHFDNSQFYSLDLVGTFIWERCDGQHSIAEIAQQIVNEYEVSPEQAAKDCLEFIEDLHKQGLLEISEPPRVAT
jgi:hypothetical protein